MELHDAFAEGWGVESIEPEGLAVLRGRAEDVDGQEGVYERLIAPDSGSVRFAKAPNRSVTGSMNDMMTPAAYWPAAGDVPPFDIGTRVNETPMSALKPGGPPYGFPRDVFEALVELAEGGRPMPAA